MEEGGNGDVGDFSRRMVVFLVRLYWVDEGGGDRPLLAFVGFVFKNLSWEYLFIVIYDMGSF